MDKYNLDTVIKLPFPKFEEYPNETWARVWRIGLSTTGIDLINTFIENYSDQSIFIQFHSFSDDMLTLRVLSKMHAGSDKVMFATYNFFVELDKEVALR